MPSNEPVRLLTTDSPQPRAPIAAERKEPTYLLARSYTDAKLKASKAEAKAAKKTKPSRSKPEKRRTTTRLLASDAGWLRRRRDAAKPKKSFAQDRSAKRHAARPSAHLLAQHD